MKKRLFKVSVVTILILILGSALVAWQNNIVFAKKQVTSVKLTPAERMAKYSVKINHKSVTPIRRSRLTQINVISEAANVLNVLPITIMDEMKKGKTLVQIAKGKGLTKAQFLRKLTDLDNKTVAAAVKAGTISKEHGDALKKGRADRLNYNLTLKAMNVNDHKAMDMNH